MRIDYVPYDGRMCRSLLICLLLITGIAANAQSIPGCPNPVAGQPSFSPNCLSFETYAGGADPSPQTATLSIPAGFSPANWTATATTTSGGNWLSVSTAEGSGPETLTVTVSGIAAFTAGGVYKGAVNVTFGSVVVTLPVLLTLDLSFSALPGTLPPAQQVSLTTSSAWTASFAGDGTGNWLALSLGNVGVSTNPEINTSAFGAGNATLTATITQSLPAGTHTGLVTITMADGSPSQFVSVTFGVSSTPLGVSVSTISFSGYAGETDAKTQNVAVTVYPSNAPWKVASITNNQTTKGNLPVGWLTVAPSGNTGSGSLTFTASLVSVVPQNYSATVVLSLGGITTSIVVNLTVTGPPVSVTPSTLTFSVMEGPGHTAPPQTFLLLTSSPAPSWTAEYPPFLTLDKASGVGTTTIAVGITGTNTLQPAAYGGQIQLTFYGPAGLNGPQVVEVVVVPIVVNVQKNPDLQLTVTPQHAALLTEEGISTLPPLAVQVGLTQAAEVLPFSATSDQPWILAGASGSSTSALEDPNGIPYGIRFDTSALSPGAYSGRVTFSSPGRLDQSVNVTVLVQQASPSLGVVPPTATFALYRGAHTSLPRSFEVVNYGLGGVDWTVSTTNAFLQLPISQGTTSNALPADFEVTVSPTGDPDVPLPDTSYWFGSVHLETNGAPVVTPVVPITLEVWSDLNPVIRDGGLVFLSDGGGGILGYSRQNPASARSVPAAAASQPSQTIVLQGAATVTATANIVAGGSWLSVSPAASLLSPNGATFTISASPTGLTPGVYDGRVSFSFDNGAPSLDVPVRFVAVAQNCTPSRTVAGIVQPTPGFSPLPGMAVPITVQVMDDCANPVKDSTVVARFSTGDPDVVLSSNGDGTYSGLWAGSAPGPVDILVEALHLTLTQDSFDVTGTVRTSTTALPVLTPGGVVSAAGFVPGGMAPGSIVSVFGVNLAQGQNSSSGFPLPTVLGNLKLTMGGIDMPLFYAGNGQVNAQVPAELTPGTPAQLLARYETGAGELPSVPITVPIATTSPAIFDEGGGQGAVVNYPQNQLVNSAAPARAGDVITIYCTGLGATNPAVSTGAPAPTTTLAQAVIQPTLTIGGQTAQVLFAGLTPGEVGLYQVNALVPMGVAAGNAVPVVLTQNGVTSNSETIAVQ